MCVVRRMLDTYIDMHTVMKPRLMWHTVNGRLGTCMCDKASGYMQSGL